MNDLDAASMRALCDEHGATLCRDGLRPTGDRARAEHVAQATLLRAWRPPEVFKDSERSVSSQHRAVIARRIPRSGRPRRSPTIAEFPKVP
jgi:DNA-directed RNA polymerase specialized sigma24 family protein